MIVRFPGVESAVLLSLFHCFISGIHDESQVSVFPGVWACLFDMVEYQTIHPTGAPFFPGHDHYRMKFWFMNPRGQDLCPIKSTKDFS